MWLASGIDAYVTEPPAAAAGSPGNGASSDVDSDEPKSAANAIRMTMSIPSEQCTSSPDCDLHTE
jgi:hypothetical protein